MNKTLSYFRLATSLYDADYFIKSDDDVFVRLDRLPTAIMQWQKRKAGEAVDPFSLLSPALHVASASCCLACHGGANCHTQCCANQCLMCAPIDYVGCFKTGQPQTNPSYSYYEPHHVAIGDSYYA